MRIRFMAVAITREPGQPGGVPFIGLHGAVDHKQSCMLVFAVAVQRD